MTRDQLSELQQVATDVARWLEQNGALLFDLGCPVGNLRTLARLASMAANELELKVGERGERRGW